MGVHPPQWRHRHIWAEPLVDLDWVCPLLVGNPTTFGGNTPLMGPVYESRAVTWVKQKSPPGIGPVLVFSIYQGSPF